MNSSDDFTPWSELEKEIVSCRVCPRLVSWREEVARTRRRAYRDWNYWGKPVPGFGDPSARLLVVGLAPGAHGSNRTGRMFTGDASGEFLYQALWQAGFSNRPVSENRFDDLRLKDVYITAVCRCVPPDNRPSQDEILNCRRFLLAEIEMLENLSGFVALGAIAFEQILTLFRLNGVEVGKPIFRHGQFLNFGPGLPWLLASYHPSRQNTQTGRLTTAMFADVWQKARRLLDGTEFSVDEE